MNPNYSPPRYKTLSKSVTFLYLSILICKTGRAAPPAPTPHMSRASVEHKDLKAAAPTLPSPRTRACWKLISTALPGGWSQRLH